MSVNASQHRGTRAAGIFRGNAASCLAQRQLLHPEVADFADVEDVLGSAIDRVDRAELLEQLAGPAEFADDRAVEAHLGDLARGIEIVRRIRIRHVHHLVAAGRDAERLRVADILDLALERPIVVEDLDALVAAIGRIDVALGIDGDAVDAGELAGRVASLAPRLDEHAVLRELGDARVAAAVGDEDVALRVPGDVGRAIEEVLRRTRARSAAAASAGLTPAPAAASFSSAAALTAAAGARSAGTAGILNRLRFASEQEHDAALRIELNHHRRVLVDDPEVVLRIDADLRGEEESVDALADLAREFSGAIELEQPRAAVHERTRRRDRHRRGAGARVGEDVAA